MDFSRSEKTEVLCVRGVIHVEAVLSGFSRESEIVTKAPARNLRTPQIVAV